MRFVAFLLTAAVLLAEAPPYQMIATSKQIMAAVQKPAMDSLTAMGKAGGPKDEKEWEVAAQNAAVLAETAQLLLLGTRPKDQDIWLKSSQRLQAAATDSTKAATDKNLDAWKTSLNGMAGACRSCHNVHKKKQQQ